MKLTLTVNGAMEELVKNIMQARSISPQEAVRLLIGDIMVANLRNPEILQNLQTLQNPENLENPQIPENPPLAPAPGSTSVSSPSSPPPVETAEEPSLPLTPSPPVRPRAPKRAKTAEGEADFEAFYAAFPRHENKADAGKAWLDIESKRPALSEILAAVAAQTVNKQWNHEKKFCPLPASWLRAMRWRDEVTPDNGNGGRLPYGSDPRRTAGGHPTPQPSQVKRFNPEDPDART